MKIKILVFIGILILFVAPITLAEEISLDEAMKIYCGTWFYVEGAPEERGEFNPDGTFGLYYPKIIAPTYSGTFKIEKAWKDNESNVWLITSISAKRGVWDLKKISNNGSVVEGTTLMNLDKIPAEISPDDYRYYKGIKKKNE